MFLHIGENIVIQKENIVAILDKKVADSSKDTKSFIENMIKNGLLVNQNNDEIKTYIITCDKKVNRINREDIEDYSLYTSNISSTTLFNRNKYIERIGGK